MAVTRKSRSFEEALVIALEIIAIDRALMDMATGENCLTLSAKDNLVAMLRKLRKMRIAIEVEGGLPDLGRLLSRTERDTKNTVIIAEE